MAKKTLLTCTLVLGLSPLVTGCVTTQDHKNLQLKVRNQNNRIVELEHSLDKLSSGGGDSTKTLQRLQADLAAEVDRLKMQLLQVSGQMEEATYRNRTLLEENQTYQQEITQKINSLDETDKLIQGMLETTNTQISEIAAVLEAEAKRKQDQAVKAAELARQKAIEAEQVRLKAEQDLQNSNSGSNVVTLTPRKEKTKNTGQVKPAVASPEATKTIVPAAPKTAAEKLYDKGLGEYRAENYKAAIESFTLFLDNNKKHKLEPNAKYWLGVCRFNDNDLPGAVLEFQHIVADFPDHPKAPEALMKQAEAFAYFGEKNVEKKLYQDVLNYYPKSEQAKKAKAKLSKL